MDELNPQEKLVRVYYALSQPLARLGQAYRTDLSSLSSLLQLAYFSRLKGEGLKLKDIAERLGISERTAKRLQKQLRETFAALEADYDLPARIEFMLWASPMSAVRIKQVLRKTPAKAIDRAIEKLLASDRIQEGPAPTHRLEVTQNITDLARDVFMAKLGGLNAFMSNLTDAVYGRFFAESPKAFARTLDFLIRPEDIGELETLFWQQLVPKLAELDERAQASQGEGEAFRLSTCWAPFDLANEASQNMDETLLDEDEDSSEIK